MANIVSATFDSYRNAQDAVDWLRAQGVPDSAISVIARESDDLNTYRGGAADRDAGNDAAEAGGGALAGAGAGADVGALFGLAAAAIPGVGPFITAGALSAALGPTLGGAAAGAVVGGVSGTVAGALTGWGVNKQEAEHYAGEVERGNTYVGVDLDRTTLTADTVRDAFRQYQGRFYS
ncbi:MAG: hypothetical protein KY468_05770 [Armatimonadetes bacterium]|nr:hypothetical protein [Armatimonadota bacterium]